MLPRRKATAVLCPERRAIIPAAAAAAANNQTRVPPYVDAAASQSTANAYTHVLFETFLFSPSFERTKMFKLERITMKRIII